MPALYLCVYLVLGSRFNISPYEEALASHMHQAYAPRCSGWGQKVQMLAALAYGLYLLFRRVTVNKLVTFSSSVKQVIIVLSPLRHCQRIKLVNTWNPQKNGCQGMKAASLFTSSVFVSAWLSHSLQHLPIIIIWQQLQHQNIRTLYLYRS